METMTQTIDEAIADYCDRLTPAYIAGCCGGNDPIQRGIAITHKPKFGKVYAKILHTETVEKTGQVVAQCVTAFVKLEDGTIWKPAGWKGPAKNFPRGNVYDLAGGVAWSL